MLKQKQKQDEVHEIDIKDIELQTVKTSNNNQKIDNDTYTIINDNMPVVMIIDEEKDSLPSKKSNKKTESIRIK